jgi:CubicO group peptidase (beta-lactamase class C family)
MANKLAYGRLLLLLALFISCGSARSEQRPKPSAAFKPPGDFAAKATEYMRARASATGFSGTVLVAHTGRPIFREGYGLASREFDIPNTPTTKFQVASVTKPFTAAAILLPGGSRRCSAGRCSGTVATFPDTSA